MNAVFTQILASAVRPDGSVDREKICRDLHTTTESPEVLLVDAVIAVDAAIRRIHELNAFHLQELDRVIRGAEARLAAVGIEEATKAERVAGLMKEGAETYRVAATALAQTRRMFWFGMGACFSAATALCSYAFLVRS